MSGDRIRPSRLSAEQERALAHYVRRDVYPHSAFYRRLIEESGLRPAFARTPEEFARLPVTSLDVATERLAELVLAAPAEGVIAEGDRVLAARLLWARVSGKGQAGAAEILDPLFRPVLWTVDGALRVAWTAGDLDRLAELGRRWLEQAGLRATDLVVSLVEDAASTAFWQLHLGTRRGGVAMVSVDRTTARTDGVAQWDPTVLAGARADVERVLEDAICRGDELARLHTVLVVDEPIDDEARRWLTDLAAAAAGPTPPVVVLAWAAPGARALWSECRGGTSFHLWPVAELVEMVDGEVVWSAVGWRGTALLRLATGVVAELDERRCRVCGRTTPRLVVSGRRAPAA